MIIDKHIYCINQPGLFKPCDYMLCQYSPSAYAEVNSKYSGIFVKYYGDGKFEFLSGDKLFIWEKSFCAEGDDVKFGFCSDLFFESFCSFLGGKSSFIYLLINF